MPAKTTTKKEPPKPQISPEDQKKLTDLWALMEPVFSGIIRTRNVDPKDYSDVYNAIFANRGILINNPDLFIKNLEELFKTFLSEKAREEAQLSPERQVEHFGECWGRWYKASDVLVDLLSYIERYVCEFRVRTMMLELWKNHMFSEECKQNLVRVVCDIIDEHRRGEPANLPLVGKLVSSLRHMDSNYSPQQKKPGQRAGPTYVTVGGRQPQQQQTGRGKPSDAESLTRQLQKDVLAHTRQFYTQKSGTLESMTPAEAIKYVNDVCFRERDLIEKYVDLCKKEELDKALNEVLILDHLDYFFKGFEEVVLSCNVELESAIKNLYSRVEKIENLLEGYFDILKRYMLGKFEEFKRTMDAEKAKPKDPKDKKVVQPSFVKFVELASSEYKKFRANCITAFNETALDAHPFEDKCDAAFRETLNNNAVISGNNVSKDLREISSHRAVAKILANYADNLLSQRKGNEKELGEKEDDLISLYMFLKDKESFQSVYRNNLARRLLFESNGYEGESAFLDKLKRSGNCEEFGKATAMVKDIANRPDFSAQFSDYLAAKGIGKSFATPLLCSASWSLVWPTQSFKLPKKMADFVTQFQDFISRRGSKIKVCLLNQYGRGELSFCTGSKDYTMQGTEFQLALLPMIGKDGVTVQRLMDETYLPLITVKVELAFLLKHKLLLAKGEKGLEPIDSRKLLPSTVVVINQKFDHKTKKFSCIISKPEEAAIRAAEKTANKSGAEGSESTAEPEPESAEQVSQEEAESIMEDQILRSECIIVRVMKTRRKADTDQVFAETAKQLARFFPVSQTVFRKACEKLVDDGLLKRKSRKEVEYIA